MTVERSEAIMPMLHIDCLIASFKIIYIVKIWLINAKGLALPITRTNNINFFTKILKDVWHATLKPRVSLANFVFPPPLRNLSFRRKAWISSKFEREVRSMERAKII